MIDWRVIYDMKMNQVEIVKTLGFLFDCGQSELLDVFIVLSWSLL